MKAQHTSEVISFQDIPNIGPKMAADFLKLGLKDPQDLKTQDAFQLYSEICRLTGKRHDPCVLDTYMAAIDFMNGASACPWYDYTAQRKHLYPDI